MGPELVITDFGGIHNKNGDVTRSRLVKSASWRRQRIICVIPADALIPAKCALAIWSLIFPPNNNVVRILCQGCEVGAGYSAAIEGVLSNSELKGWEFVLCIEQDNLPPQDGVLKLVESMEAHPELSAIGGLYFCKGENGCSQIWGDPRDPIMNFRPQVPVPETVQECVGLGMGFTMFRLSMFKDPALRRPWFVTQKGVGGVSTQDLYFWSDARKLGYRCAVDTRVKTGHMDIQTGVVW